MATKEKTTTSWADETDDYEDTEPQTTQKTNAWSKGNPLVTKDEKRESSQEKDNHDDNNHAEPRENQEPRRERDEQRRDREYPRERRERKLVPFPETAPFTAFVGNLVYDVASGELADFFERAGCRVARDGVRLMMNKENKPKGKGYVEFEDIKSLQRAVSLNGEPFLGRDIRVDVAERKEDRPRREYGNRDRRDRGYGNRDRNYGRGDRTPPRDRSPSRGEDEERRERPKINLLPRTTSTDASSPEAQRSKANPFGDAKPRDENAFLKKKEEEKKQRDTKPESPAKDTNHEEQKDNRPPREEHRRDDRPPRDAKPRDDNRGPRRDDRGPRRDDRRDDRRGNDRRDNRRGGRDDRGPRRDDRGAPRPLPKQEEKVAQVQSKNIFAALGDTDE